MCDGIYEQLPTFFAGSLRKLKALCSTFFVSLHRSNTMPLNSAYNGFFLMLFHNFTFFFLPVFHVILFCLSATFCVFRCVSQQHLFVCRSLFRVIDAAVRALPRAVGTVSSAAALNAVKTHLIEMAESVVFLISVF